MAQSHATTARLFHIPSVHWSTLSTVEKASNSMHTESYSHSLIHLEIFIKHLILKELCALSAFPKQMVYGEDI